MVLLKYRLKKNTADRIFSVFLVLLFDFFVLISMNAPHDTALVQQKPSLSATTIQTLESRPYDSHLATSVQKNFEIK